jgi:hypothetical protein
MLPWVIDLLKRLPRRLRSDGEEFILLTPEGKPMTDAWWPKRGTARRPVDDESNGIWFRCLRRLGIRPRKFYTTRHTFIAWALSEAANLKGLAGWLRHVTTSKFRCRLEASGRRPSVRSRADRVYQISYRARLWRS